MTIISSSAPVERPHSQGRQPDKPCLDLVEILIEQGRKEEAIIAQMSDAVAANDKDKVFELAKLLVDNGSNTENSRRAA